MEWNSREEAEQFISKLEKESVFPQNILTLEMIQEILITAWREGYKEGLYDLMQLTK